MLSNKVCELYGKIKQVLYGAWWVNLLLLSMIGSSLYVYVSCSPLCLFFSFLNISNTILSMIYKEIRQNIEIPKLLSTSLNFHTSIILLSALPCYTRFLSLSNIECDYAGSMLCVNYRTLTLIYMYDIITLLNSNIETRKKSFIDAWKLCQKYSLIENENSW